MSGLCKKHWARPDQARLKLARRSPLVLLPAAPCLPMLLQAASCRSVLLLAAPHPRVLLPGGAAGDRPLSLVEAVERLRQQDPGAAPGGATPGAAPGGAAMAGRPAVFPEPPSRGEPPSTAASETVTYLGAPANAAPAEQILVGPPTRAPPVPWGGVIIGDKWHPSDSSIHNLADYESVFLASTAETMHRHGATDKAIADSYWEVNILNLIEGQKQEGDDDDDWGDWGARQEFREWKGHPQEYFLQQYDYYMGHPPRWKPVVGAAAGGAPAVRRPAPAVPSPAPAGAKAPSAATGGATTQSAASGGASPKSLSRIQELMKIGFGPWPPEWIPPMPKRPPPPTDELSEAEDVAPVAPEASQPAARPGGAAAAAQSREALALLLAALALPVLLLAAQARRRQSRDRRGFNICPGLIASPLYNGGGPEQPRPSGDERRPGGSSEPYPRKSRLPGQMLRRSFAWPRKPSPRTSAPVPQKPLRQARVMVERAARLIQGLPEAARAATSVPVPRVRPPGLAAKLSFSGLLR